MWCRSRLRCSSCSAGEGLEVVADGLVGAEEFNPLGEPDTTENPKPGEIIYVDTTGVLTRHWHHRDSHRTRVTDDSTHAAFVLETLHATRV